MIQDWYSKLSEMYLLNIKSKMLKMGWVGRQGVGPQAYSQPCWNSIRTIVIEE